MSNTNALKEIEHTKRISTMGLGRFYKALPRIKSALLLTCLALSVMIASTQRSNAAFYDNYASLNQYYYNLYLHTGVPQYYYAAIGFLYYYYAGYYGDYYGYQSDPVAYKSTNYRGSTTAAGYYYNLYAYYGDYYIRH
jgi:hypothetical protein